MTETRLITHRLIDDLKTLSESSSSMYWMTAFAMTSGVKLVLPQLKAASARGCEIKMEYHLQAGVDSSMVKREFGTYFNLLKASGELNDKELQVLQDYEDWFLEVERTGMTKSYKMVLLRCMLTRGENEWFLPIQAIDCKMLPPLPNEQIVPKEH